MGEQGGSESRIRQRHQETERERYRGSRLDQVGRDRDLERQRYRDDGDSELSCQEGFDINSGMQFPQVVRALQCLHQRAYVGLSLGMADTPPASGAGPCVGAASSCELSPFWLAVSSQVNSLSLFLLSHSLGCYLMLAPSNCPQGIQAWSLP